MKRCFNFNVGRGSPAPDALDFLYPWPTSVDPLEATGIDAPSWSDKIPTGTAASASTAHSQAEKRRRDRINTHLATLRKLVSRPEKMDKAALLGRVIERVNDLKSKAVEASKVLPIPAEVDEVIIVDCFSDLCSNTGPSTTSKYSDAIFIRVSVCCEDRPDLFQELIRAFAGLGLSTVRADIASLGGRIKTIIVLSAKNIEGDSSLASLKDSIQIVLRRIATLSSPSSRFASKRQRFFWSSH